MSATETDPAQIERELGETRSRLGGHLDALQNRLSPGQLLDDVMAQLRSNGGAEFGRNLLDSVRANPLPAALTGVGLAWMMASNGRNTGTVANALPDPIRSDINARLRKAELGVRRAADEPEHAYDARLASARGQVLGVARHAQETTSSFSARVADAMAAAGICFGLGARRARAAGQCGGGVARRGRVDQHVDIGRRTVIARSRWLIVGARPGSGGADNGGDCRKPCAARSTWRRGRRRAGRAVAGVGAGTGASWRRGRPGARQRGGGCT